MAAAPQKGAAKRPRRWRRWWRVSLPILGILVLALVAARLAMPSLLKRYVNRVLERSPEYDGSISEVEVHLWRGAYSIRDIRIQHIRHAVPVPFFECPRLDLALDWRALGHGLARGRIVMEKPHLNFVVGPSADETQTGADQPWLGMLNDLFPFRIDSAEVHEGEIAFHTFHTSPQVHVNLTEVEAELKNLTNVADTTDPLMATVQARGTALGSGRFEFDMKLDPESHRPTFDLATRILDLDVTRLNDLAMAYGGFDFSQGRFDVVVEATSHEGFIQGYTKPLFRDVHILGPEDFQRGPVAVLWESLVSVVGDLVKNWPRDQIGTRVTFEGEMDNPRTSLIETIGNLLRNAFIQAYLPRFEGRVAPDLTTHVEASDGIDTTGRERSWPER
jgi:hypothetical protein